MADIAAIECHACWITPFQNAGDTLLWAKASVPDINKVPKITDLDQDPSATVSLNYLAVLDELTQQAPLDFFVLLSPVLVGRAKKSGQAYHNGFRSAFANRRNELAAQGKRQGATLALQAGPWKPSAPAGNDNSPFAPFEAQAALSLIEVALSQRGSPIAVANARNQDAAVLALLDSVSRRPLVFATGQKPVAEAAFEQVLAKLKNAEGEARERILLETNLDEFSDSQLDQMYALVFKDAPKSETEAAPVVLGDEKQLQEQDASLSEIKAVIDAELKNVLRLDNAAVSERGSFQQYGLDSISGMQLVSRLEKTLGMEVPPRWLIDYSTIETLSEKIAERQQAVMVSTARPEAERAKAVVDNSTSGQGVSLRQIKSVIEAELKSVLRLDNTTVTERGSFQQFGLDSISGMQLVSRLEKMLGMEVPPRWLIDYSTVETLSEKISERQLSVAAASAH